MYGHFDSLMFRIVFVCVLPTLLRTKQLPGKWAIPVTNNGTVLRGFAIAGQDRLCYDVKDRSLDDSVTTKGIALLLSKIIPNNKNNYHRLSTYIT